MQEQALQEHNLNGPRKGADLNLNMDITFEEAFLGVEKEIHITRP